MILADLLEDVEHRVSSTDKHEWKLCCPFCQERGHELPDKGFRLGVNIASPRAHCYRCDWAAKGLEKTAQGLARGFGLTFDLRSILRDARRLKSVVVEDVPEPISQSMWKDEQRPQETGMPNEWEPFHHLTDKVEKQAYNYLKKRGIEAWQIARHSIGYAACGFMAWRIVFPVYGPGDKIYGAVGRDFTDRQTPKYLNTPNLKLLWNAEGKDFKPALHTAVVGEGIIDGLKIERALLAQKEYRSVVKLGSSMSPYQYHQLSRFKKVIFFPDWDTPGIKSTLETATKCAETTKNVCVIIPYALNERDPGEMGDDEIQLHVGRAVRWTKNTEYRLRALLGRYSAIA